MRSRANPHFKCGTLLPITSLPSPYGIGTLGAAAFDFVDFLKKSGQNEWQILPLCPIGEGNSPYKSPCSFAGEPLLIDLDLLCEEGLLRAEELPERQPSARVDYPRVRQEKEPLLLLAAARFDTTRTDFHRFCRQNAFWLNDYAMFCTIVQEEKPISLSEISADLRARKPQALTVFRLTHAEQIRTHKVLQFLFYKQFFAVKEYANQNGIRLIGDLPFYVSPDSMEVWKHTACFRVGQDLVPTQVAGVPPDLFSESGQLWGNPIYDWVFLRRSGYAFWKQRLGHSLHLFDRLRIDHFRAFADYYAIPFGAPDARCGVWERGVGLEFWKRMHKTLGALPILAEDLGGEDAAVQKLLHDTGFPGMKVLQFAFSKDLANPFLPRNFTPNCVCYTGTHDNNTTLGWYRAAKDRERRLFSRLAPRVQLSVPHRLILMGLRSRAERMIVPMQDWLNLDETARMNTPGTLSGNWEWRLSDGSLTETLVQKVAVLCAERRR